VKNKEQLLVLVEVLCGLSCGTYYQSNEIVPGLSHPMLCAVAIVGRYTPPSLTRTDRPAALLLLLLLLLLPAATDRLVVPPVRPRTSP
jgi:hypothetical protein